MPDAVLIPDSRSRQAQARRNRLLEQSIKNLATIQRRMMREKKGDLDALTASITKMALSITQVVRLHHQIWQEEAPSGDTLASLIRLLESTMDTDTTEETR